jgi:3-hydroxybutyryl-CoA dehydrogenase
MPIKKITVIGAGTMGFQIALQIAKSGYEVSIYARHPERLQEIAEELRRLLVNRGNIPAPAVEDWLKKAEKIKVPQDPQEALREADLVVEAVSENLDLKRNMFALMDSLAPRDAILSTTSSTIPISSIEDATQRPDRCLNLHFYQPPLLNNMVDIMAGRWTTAEVIKVAQEFVRAIGCVPLLVKKEMIGLGFARILHSLYQQALSMWAGGYMDFRDMDRAWMIFTKMPQGPFGLMDAIGLDVLFDLLTVYYQESKSPQDHPPQALKEMIDRNELGRKTGKGFYTYPHPEYTRPEFLIRPL